MPASTWRLAGVSSTTRMLADWLVALFGCSGFTDGSLQESGVPFSRDERNHAQARHSRKLLDIVSQYRQIMTTSRGRNEQIVCADHLPLLRQLGIYFGMYARGRDRKVQ